MTLLKNLLITLIKGYQMDFNYSHHVVDFNQHALNIV